LSSRVDEVLGLEEDEDEGQEESEGASDEDDETVDLDEVKDDDEFTGVDGDFFDLGVDTFL